MTVSDSRPLRVKKLVVITAGRAGSQVLIDLLDHHPLIQCDGEIFAARRVIAPWLSLRSRVWWAGKRGARAYGFKLLVNQLEDKQRRDPSAFIQRLSADGWLLLHLRRRNLLHQALSALRAQKTEYHYECGEAPAFVAHHIDPAEIITAMVLLARLNERTESAVAHLDHLEMVYEQDLRAADRHQRTMDMLCDRLGLPSAPARTGLARVQPDHAQQMVANFDQVASALEAVGFGRYLDP